MKRIRLSEAADSDLRKIAEETLQRWGEDQRDSYIAEIFEAFERLSATPDIAMQLDGVRKGYRKFPQGSHIIFFRKSAFQSIEIIRVLHKRMDVEVQLSSP
ncbi:MAG: type II toxin-antitoxin system RelE/ParE family toxin [Alcanivoracaceae bacterium]|nr:type II toxin-antitoxin system RelE/ParE family toxin [Alcanivoracaceae bacterium]